MYCVLRVRCVTADVLRATCSLCYADVLRARCVTADVLRAACSLCDGGCQFQGTAEPPPWNVNGSTPRSVYRGQPGGTFVLGRVGCRCGEDQFGNVHEAICSFCAR